jgi:hypothetical protein
LHIKNIQHIFASINNLIKNNKMENLEKNVRKAVTASIKELKEYSWDWYAYVYVYDNGATAYRLKANGLHMPKQLHEYGNVTDGVLLECFEIKKGYSIKPNVEFILSEVKNFIIENEVAIIE